MAEPTVEVVLPCLDEAAALPAVIDAIHAIDGMHALVVDNGSTDGSPEVAAARGARVVHEPQRGYGAAAHTGLVSANAEIVCVMDADGSIDAAQLPELIEPIRSGRAKLVTGRRVVTELGGFPWHARVGNALIAWMVRRRGVDVRDLAPVRVARRVDLVDLDIRDRAFGYPLELLLRAGKSGWTVIEKPVRYLPRTAGTQSKVAGSVKGTARAVRDMAQVLR